MKKLITSIFLLLILAGPVWGASIYVGTGGSNTSPYETAEKAATTIGTINAYDPGAGSHTLYLITGAVPNDATLTLAGWTNVGTEDSLQFMLYK